MVSLIRKYLVSGVMIDDEYKESIIGTPQGENLSPLLSNIMLNELDWELERRGLNFVRYADSVMKLKAKIKELTSRRWGVSKNYRIMHLNWAIRGWINYFRIANMKMMCKEIDKHMRFRLRICIWKQWKKPRTRYKFLIKLRIPIDKSLCDGIL